MPKKLAALLMISALCLPAFPLPAVAQKVFMDLEDVQGATAITMNGIIMAPVRPIAKKAGCTVAWSAQKRQMSVTRPHEDMPAIMLEVGKTTAFFSQYEPELKDFVTGEEPLPAAPMLRGGVLYAPVDFIAQRLGYTIDYNVDSSDIYIFSPQYHKNQQGEGIGSAPAAGKQTLSKEQKKYVLSIGTDAWTQLEEADQNALLDLIRRWWKAELNFTPSDDFADNMGRQMGQYYRTKTEIGIFATACELEGLDPQPFMKGLR